MTGEELKGLAIGTKVWVLTHGKKEPQFGCFKGYRSEVDRVYVGDENVMSNKRWLYRRLDVFLSREEAMDNLKLRAKPSGKDYDTFCQTVDLLEANMLRDESEFEQLSNKTTLLRSRIETSRVLIKNLRKKMEQLEKQNND